MKKTSFLFGRKQISLLPLPSASEEKRGKAKKKSFEKNFEILFAILKIFFLPLHPLLEQRVSKRRKTEPAAAGF